MEYNKLYKSGLFFIIFIYGLCYGQNYRVNYQMSYKRDSLSKEFTKKNMVLLIKNNKSKFYTQDQFISDSITLTSKKTGRYGYDFMVIKDHQGGKIYRFTNLLRDLYKSSDKMPVLNWKISKETKKIGDYMCQKATLNYSNRIWEAWFTTDIPLQEGPYVFSGTPGLIINLKDTKDNYEFSFTGIKKDDTTDIEYLSMKPLDVSRIQLNKILLDNYNDPYREMKSGKIKARWQDEDGKEFTPNYNELTKAEQKNIKKYNNPIELLEAVKYP